MQPEHQPAFPYLNTALTPAERASDLVGRMTLEEKALQMGHTAPAIQRLGVPAYNWWNECLHGVGRAGIATVFPQAIGLAATFDEPLMHRVATAISDEARAKHHEALRSGPDTDWYFGLTFWSPNVNIFRDPRWGRGQETYGEDPYLTSRLGVAFVRGLQGDDPRHLKVVATPKHYAVHSGPEALRHGFDAIVSDQDLHETYLPAFRACVLEGGARSVMPAYNRTNGEACAASPTLLAGILRGAWGFRGYVVSDCGAIGDIFAHHCLASTPAEAAALAVDAGCDLCCGDTYCALGDAVIMGLLPESSLDRSLLRLFEARFHLGMFDPPSETPYASIPYSVNDCEEHRRLAAAAAARSLVLLKNTGTLPIAAGVTSIAVVGPNADDVGVLLGNYNGTPSSAVTILDGIRRRAGQSIIVREARGCDLVGADESGFAEAVGLASAADLTVAVVGLSPRLEGEEGEEGLIDPSGDRVDIGLPAIQEQLLKALHATGTPLVVVLLSGSAVTSVWAEEHADAILAAWYGGEEAGTAVAGALFGDFSPGGRLPVTVYRSAAQLPPFASYGMEGRTYRFMHDDPLYPFGYGLSYTKFEYTDLRFAAPTALCGAPVHVAATVRNVGERTGDEVVQLYLTDVESTMRVPIRSLAGFRRITLAPGESASVEFEIDPRQMACYDEGGVPVIEPGLFRVAIGGGQPDVARRGSEPIVAMFGLTGPEVLLPL